MTNEDDVVFRKGMSKEEICKAKEKITKEHVKSHAGEGAFAGFLLFITISKLTGASMQVTGILCGLGAALGGFIGHWEALHRARKLKRNDSPNTHNKEDSR